MILKNIFVWNVQNNMDLRYVNKNKRNILFYYKIFLFLVKQRTNQHRRDFSDSNAEHKVN